MEAKERIDLYNQMTVVELVFMNQLVNAKARELFLEYIKQTREIKTSY